MAKCQSKNTVSNNQYNISPLEPRNHDAAGPEYFTIAEAQEKILKIACMNMIALFLKEMNMSHK